MSQRGGFFAPPNLADVGLRARAGDALRGVGQEEESLDGNVVAASDAEAELGIVDALESGFEAGEFLFRLIE